MNQRLFLSDVIIIAYASLLSAIALIGQIPDWLIFCLFHLLAIALVLLVHLGYSRNPNRFWTLVKYWMVIIFVLAAYREVYYFVPAVTSGVLYDRALQELDQSIFGTLANAHNILPSNLLSDVLSVCYWMYFPMPIILGLVLYSRNLKREFRNGISALLLGWFVSYIGYILVPALGPYATEFPRAEHLSGYVLADIMHNSVMLNIQWGAPDAFPSGHTLVTLMTLTYAFRFHRKTFYWILPFGSGLILATVYLRYHYLIDVMVSMLLWPLLVWCADRLFNRWERTRR